jgi:hypothetical protein
VTIRFGDGRVMSTEVVDSIGTQRRPLARAQIVAKGDGLGQASRGVFVRNLAKCIWDPAQGDPALAEVLTRA